MTNLEIKLENIVMNQKLKLMEENISPELKAFGLKMLQENSQLFSSLIQENLQDVRDRLNAGYNNAKTYVHEHRGSFGLGTGALAGAAAAYMLNQSDDEPLAQVNPSAAPTAPVVSQTTTVQSVEKHLPNPHENHDIRTENKPQISNGEQHGSNPLITKQIQTTIRSEDPAPTRVDNIGGHQVVDDRMYLQSNSNGMVPSSNSISAEEKQRLIQNAFNGFR